MLSAFAMKGFTTRALATRLDGLMLNSAYWQSSILRDQKRRETDFGFENGTTVWRNELALAFDLIRSNVPFVPTLSVKYHMAVNGLPLASSQPIHGAT